MEQHLNFIGTIHSSLKNLGDCPRQENEGAPAVTVEVYAPFTEGIKDMQSGDKIILLTWLHKGDRSVLSTRPRNDPNAPMTGVFSTRSPDRPNPIGIHFVKVTSVLPGNKLQISALEVLDQTPLIDIKPDLR
jgi:tRNA-Thr(GGU) m(6)t(6)A37 methyltransferase TsaA